MMDTDKPETEECGKDFFGYADPCILPKGHEDACSSTLPPKPEVPDLRYIEEQRVAALSGNYRTAGILLRAAIPMLLAEINQLKREVNGWVRSERSGRALPYPEAEKIIPNSP